jgi:1-acyl-sn-glycerol-3-phosphate acyltransferase
MLRRNVELVAVRGPIGWGLYNCCRYFSWGGAVALGGVRHFGRPSAAQVEGGLLVASNHQSFFDPVLIGMAMPRQICYLARDTLFDVPGFGALIHAVGARPVRRGAVSAGTLKTVLGLLRAGEALLMFPEGTRTWDGSLGELSPGVAAIAVRSGVPVLPVCIEGAYRCWPRTRLLPRRSPIAVAFGRPIGSAGKTAEGLTARLREEMLESRAFLRERLAWSRR